MSRAYTVEEVRGQVLEHVQRMVKYWAELPELSVADKCDGVAFSILTMIDGSAAIPPLTLSVLSSPDDQAYFKERGENFYLDGMSLNDDVMLHEAYSEMVRAAGK